MELTKQQHLELYYWMQLNRKLEDLLTNLFRQNKIVGGLYSSLGQEAISVATTYALEKRDWIAPMIRNLGAVLVKGYQPRDLIMQYTAKAGSPTGGKDGTAHFGDLKQKRVISPISMLGDLIPVMTGIGLGARYLGREEVALTWIGEGGSSTGVFHEGLNFAAVRKAPLVLVLENNLWAYSTPIYLQTAAKHFADRAKGYGIPGVIVDGNDVLEVYRVTQEAVARARRGDGPTLIEAKTFRRKGHAQHDPAKYVPQWMLKEWEAKDPILRYEKHLTEKKLWTEKGKQEILARIDTELKQELAAAEASPLPQPEVAAQGVYCDGCHEIRAEWKRSPDEVKPPRNIPSKWFKGRDPALAVAAIPPVAKPEKETVMVGANPRREKKQRKQTKQERQRK
ncbi:thiamine pyrophosphate-dependent dehydrogenase E1 component subunit alpha [Acidobacteriia bacterium AH_259_A11_L15]|nr:thiamine pyrophosphate-dependent dehydrogenase E1 component subunit alpha [Acidobacteriia bacterium AH_259_A11_L15]